VKRNYQWTKGVTPPAERIMRRLFAEYGPLNPNACWIWPGARRGPRPDLKYGCVMTGSRVDGTRKTVDCHVILWEAVNGPTPEGKELHHRCMTPPCCNPVHLMPVMHQVNSVLVTEETRAKRRKALAYGREVLAETKAAV
jgi:hypothetical protein